MLPTVQFEARVVGDPTLRFSASGMAVAKIRTVASSRKKVSEGGAEKWVDDKTCWLDVTCFRQMAENVAESITDKDLVVVVGKLQTEEWEDKETGAKRSKISCVADYIGPALTFATAKVAKAERAGGPAGPPAEDPWAAPAGDDTTPPF